MKCPEYLVSGELARLIPVATNQELRNTGAVGAMLKGVREFAEALLGPLGAPIGKRAKIQVWTEPVFKIPKGHSKDRPDAFIIVDNGRRQWRALIESKAKSAKLDTEQIERYLDLSRDHGIDALITVSNQFVVAPTLTPCAVRKTKTRKVALFHWSWLFLKTEAKIQLAKCAVSDPDQAYMLEEFVRYLEHDSVGVSEFERMGKEWVEACRLYFTKSKLPKSSPICAAVLHDWDELMRSTALVMSRQLETNVTIVLSQKERKDPSQRFGKLLASFSNSGELNCRLLIPGAASPIAIEADLTRRCVTISMPVLAPKDRKRPRTSVNWLLRQLDKTKDEGVMIVAKWPGRSNSTCLELSRVREDADELVVGRTGQLPWGFELKSVSDFGGKFTQRQNFVSELVSCISKFYESVGQYVVPWQPPPPKPKNQIISEDAKPGGIEEYGESE